MSPPPAASPDPAPSGGPGGERPGTRRADPARRSGPRGEDLALRCLRATGYRLVQRNVRTRAGEIDLLMRRRRVYVAVEVKARRGHPAPERTATASQLDRVAAALRLLAPVLRPPPRALRVDVVAIRWGAAGAAGAEIAHLRAVRRLPLPGRSARTVSARQDCRDEVHGYSWALLTDPEVGPSRRAGRWSRWLTEPCRWPLAALGRLLSGRWRRLRLGALQRDRSRCRHSSNR